MGRFGLFSGCRGEIQAAAVEVDRVDEVLLVAEAAGRVLHPLDLGVEGFIVVDGETVETGSFNLTAAAEQKNAENVLDAARF